jgi:hypothetical protein
MIFAREISDSLTSLVKKIDAANAKNASMGSFVCFLSDEEKLEGQLKDLAKKEKINTTVLSILDNRAGPGGYNISKDADVTVILYNQRTVRANHAFKKGEMKEKDVEKIIADLPKILSK